MLKILRRPDSTATSKRPPSDFFFFFFLLFIPAATLRRIGDRANYSLVQKGGAGTCQGCASLGNKDLINLPPSVMGCLGTEHSGGTQSTLYNDYATTYYTR